MHAQDRFWEMDVRRHITSGRLSEMFGESQVSTDAFLRTLGWRRVAEQEVPMLSRAVARRSSTRTPRGVNAYLADHAGDQLSLEYAVLGLQNPDYRIEPWQPADSVAWLKAMAWDLRGNMDERSTARSCPASVGVEQTEKLFPPYPFAEHRPIVEGGAVVNGVFDQSATSAAGAKGRARDPPAARRLRCRSPSVSTPARSVARAERAGHRLELLGGQRRARPPPASRCWPTTRTSRR